MFLMALGSPPFLERHITVDGRPVYHCAEASEEAGYVRCLVVISEDDENIAVESDENGPVMETTHGAVVIGPSNR